MQWVLALTLSIHVLGATFWAGSSFATARNPLPGAERLFRSQMGAAAVTVLTGGYLWHLFHSQNFGQTEKILAGGIGLALLAGVIQAVVCGPARRTLMWSADAAALQRFAIGQ